MNPEFSQQMTTLIFEAVEEGAKKGVQIIWSAAMSLLATHWLLVMGVFSVIFIIAITKAAFGRWGMLGSILYNLFYLAALFVIGLVKGPEVFVSEFFEIICAIVLYPVCYFVVGVILERSGFRRRH